LGAGGLLVPGAGTALVEALGAASTVVAGAACSGKNGRPVGHNPKTATARITLQSIGLRRRSRPHWPEDGTVARLVNGVVIDRRGW